jgi:hypothetical protein
MTVDRFRGVELKVERAKLHAEALTNSIAEWTRRSPLSAKPEYLADRLGFRLVLQSFVESPPLESWGLLAGDCVHNLRSALDNLAYALAMLKRDPPADPSGIYFPVFEDAGAFAARARRTLEQLPEDAARLLEAFQPFHRGVEHMQRDALLLLHHLDRHDKHRLPQVVLLAVNQGAHIAQIEFGSDAVAAAAMPPEATMRGGPMEPGATLIEVRVKRPIARLGGNVTVEAVPAIQTLVTVEGLIPVMEALGQYTTEILARCRILQSVTGGI